MCSAVEATPSRGTAGEQERKWTERTHRRAFLEDLAKDMDIREAADWQRVTREVVERRGGRPMLRLFPSLFDLLQDTYPEREWVEAVCRRRVRPGYWDSAENRREFVAAVAKKFRVENERDWERVTKENVREMGGRRLLTMCGDSVRDMVEFAMTHAAHDSAEGVGGVRGQVPNGYWKTKENQRRFMDSVAKEFNVKSPADWRRVKTSDIVHRGGTRLLALHGSAFNLLRTLYPEQEMVEAECRPKLRAGYWEVKENRREFVQRLSRAHNVSQAEDWKTVGYNDIVNMGGKSLLKRYETVYDMLKDSIDLPPSAATALLLREQLPRGYWEQRENVRDFLETVRKEFNVVEKEDWYRISREQLASVGGGTLVGKMSLLEALRMAYPDEQWDDKAFEKRDKRSAQRQLRLYVEPLFPQLRSTAATPQ